MSDFKSIIRRWSAILHSLPRFASARPRHVPRRLTLEHLESRVVPATILVTSLLDSGNGTLRAAIEKANQGPSHSGGKAHSDTIKFAHSVRGTILLESALPVLLTHTVISGPGPALLTVARDSTSLQSLRIFTVGTGARVAISGLAITGGASAAGGGINNAGSLSLKNMWITGNETFGGLVITQGDTLGGGVDNTGTLSVTNCKFEGNSAAGNGNLAYGGAIANSGRLTVANSSFVSNATTGGVFPFSSGGVAGGGAIENASTGRVSVTGSTFSGNSATSGDTGYGGGIQNAGTLSVTNSTFCGNSATGVNGSFGGGIADSGIISLTYITADDNSATTGGGVAIVSGAQSAGNSIDSIFQNSQGGNVAVVAGSFTSLGYNLFSDNPGISHVPTDRFNANPLLGPLMNNGGPTQTLALLSGSPAIKGGTSVAGITTDQRGDPRPATGSTDQGAFQVQPTLFVKSIREYNFPDRPAVFVLAFNMLLNASRAQSLGNYSIVTEGGNAHRVGIRSAHYSAFTQAVTLRARIHHPPSEIWIVTVTGTPPHGLTNTKGDYLDGAGDGRPGTNFVVGL